MKKPDAIDIPLPVDSPLRQSMPEADFEEAFTRSLLIPDHETAAQLLKRLLFKQPRWVRGAFYLKNLIFSPLGFLPITMDNFMFTEHTPDHAVAQFEDKSFSAHLCLSIDRKNQQFILGNRVRLHSLLGKSYFFLVLPLHKRVLRHLINSLEESSYGT